jgi:acetoacetate decarboxylase
MYADDAAYIAFGREVMGWPVRDGVIKVDPEPADGLVAGVTLEASMQRAGHTVMSARLTLTGTEESPGDAGLPRWLSTKIITDVGGPRAQVSQLVVTGPERLERRIWTADASLEFGASTTDELHYLQPREIVAAQYWSELEATVGWGEVLAELGPEPWGD